MIKEFDKFTDSISSNLKAVQERFDKYQRSCFPERSPEFFCLELNGEAGELANLEKKRWKGRDVDDSLFADETADVCIALMNYANARGVNLGAAVNEKLRKIEIIRAKLAEEGNEY